MALDEASKERLGAIYNPLALRAERVCKIMDSKHSFPMRITQGLRSYEEQKKLYCRGRSKDPKTGLWVTTDPKIIVSNSPPGYSFHNYGLAVDFAFMGEDPYLENAPAGLQKHAWLSLCLACEAEGLTAGYRFLTFQDRPHAQFTRGVTIKEARNVLRYKVLC